MKKKRITKNEMVELLRHREKQTRNLYKILKENDCDEVLCEKYKTVACELFSLLVEMGIEPDHD